MSKQKLGGPVLSGHGRVLSRPAITAKLGPTQLKGYNATISDPLLDHFQQQNRFKPIFGSLNAKIQQLLLNGWMKTSNNELLEK